MPDLPQLDELTLDSEVLPTRKRVDSVEVESSASQFGSSHLFGVSPTETEAAIELPGYSFERTLGRGGMGVVHLAKQLVLDRFVAVKLMRGQFRLDDSWRERFAREARILAKMQHPNIVNIHDAGEIDGNPFLIMEWVDGGNLAERIRSDRLPVNDAVRWVRDCARGIAAAHAVGVIHRDLKPANILIADAGRTPKVTDFGLAGMCDPERLNSGVGAGTPAYMSPEQTGLVPGRVGPLSDVWALGVILYELLTGQNPFQADSTLETVQRVAQHIPPRPRTINPDVSPELDAICWRCLEKPAENRFASAEELAESLDRFLLTAILREPVRSRKSPLRRAFVALGSVAVIAIGVGVATEQLPIGMKSENPPATLATRTAPETVPGVGADLAEKLTPQASADVVEQVEPIPPKKPAEDAETKPTARLWQQAAAGETDPARKAHLHVLAAGLFLDERKLAAGMTELQLGFLAKPHASFHEPAAECYARAMTLTEDAQERERFAKAALGQLEAAANAGYFGDPFSRRPLLKRGNHYDPLRTRPDFQAFVNRVCSK